MNALQLLKERDEAISLANSAGGDAMGSLDEGDGSGSMKALEEMRGHLEKAAAMTKRLAATEVPEPVDEENAAEAATPGASA